MTEDNVTDLSLAVLKDIRNEIRDIRGDIKDMRGDIKDIRGDIKEVRGDIRQLDGRVDGLTTEVSDLRAETRRGFMRMEARFEQQLVRSGASDRALDDRVTALEVRMDRVDPPKD